MVVAEQGEVGRKSLICPSEPSSNRITIDFVAR